MSFLEIRFRNFYTNLLYFFVVVVVWPSFAQHLRHRCRRLPSRRALLICCRNCFRIASVPYWNWFYADAIWIYWRRLSNVNPHPAPSSHRFRMWAVATLIQLILIINLFDGRIQFLLIFQSLSHSTSTITSMDPPPPPHYTSVLAYPKWLFPMSIPVTMDHHVSNPTPKCILSNCPMCICQFNKC